MSKAYIDEQLLYEPEVSIFVQQVIENALASVQLDMQYKALLRTSNADDCDIECCTPTIGEDLDISGGSLNAPLSLGIEKVNIDVEEQTSHGLPKDGLHGAPQENGVQVAPDQLLGVPKEISLEFTQMAQDALPEISWANIPQQTTMCDDSPLEAFSAADQPIMNHDQIEIVSEESGSPVDDSDEYVDASSHFQDNEDGAVAVSEKDPEVPLPSLQNEVPRVFDDDDWHEDVNWGTLINEVPRVFGEDDWHEDENWGKETEHMTYVHRHKQRGSAYRRRHKSDEHTCDTAYSYRQRNRSAEHQERRATYGGRQAPGPRVPYRGRPSHGSSKAYRGRAGKGLPETYRGRPGQGSSVSHGGPLGQGSPASHRGPLGQGSSVSHGRPLGQGSSVSHRGPLGQDVRVVENCCFYCHETDHLVNDCDKRKDKEVKIRGSTHDAYCYECRTRGHHRAKCTAAARLPPRFHKR